MKFCSGQHLSDILQSVHFELLEDDNFIPNQYWVMCAGCPGKKRLCCWYFWEQVNRLLCPWVLQDTKLIKPGRKCSVLCSYLRGFYDKSLCLYNLYPCVILHPENSMSKCSLINDSFQSWLTDNNITLTLIEHFMWIIICFLLMI